MAASDDFRALIRAGKLAEALTTALSESIELEIATWVSLADPYGLEQENPDSALPGHRMKTRINIVDGEINTEVGSQFVGNGPFTELREFHLNQVQASREIIQSNLLSLQKLFSLWVEMQQNNFDPSYLGLGPNSNSPQLGGGTSVNLPEKPDIAFDEQPFEPLTSPSLEEDALLETFNEESTAQLPPENAFPVNLEASETLDLEPTEFTAAMPPAAASPQEIASPAADADIVASSVVPPTPTSHAVDDLSQVMEEFDSELFADSFSDEEEFLAVEPEYEVTQQSSDFPPEVPETQTSVDPLAVIFDRDDSSIEAQTPWREDANLTEAADLALESFSDVDEEAEAELLAALDEEPPISAVDEEAEAELLAALDEEPPIFDEVDETTPFPESLDEDLALGKTAEPSLAQTPIDSELLDEFDATEPVFWQEEEISASEAIANEEFPAEETARLSLTDEREILSKLNGTEEEAFWEETPLGDPFSAGVSESLLSDDTQEAYPDELAVETDADAAFWEQTSDSENLNSDRRSEESEFSLTDTALLGELNDITDEDINSETLEVSEGSSPFDLAEPQAEMTENVIEEIPEFDVGNLERSEEDFSPFGNFTPSETTEEPEIPLTDEALLAGLDDEGYESETDDFLTEETLEDSEELSPFELSENSETGLEEEFSPFDLAQDQPETWEESSEITSDNGLFVNEHIEDSSPFDLSEDSENIFAENQEELPEFAEEVEGTLTDDALLDELGDTEETGEFFTSETQEDVEELSPFDLGEYQADISQETTDEIPELVSEDEFFATEALENSETGEFFTSETQEDLEELSPFDLGEYQADISEETTDEMPDLVSEDEFFVTEGLENSEEVSPFESVETPEINDDLEFSLTDDELLDGLDNPEGLISSTGDLFDTEESEAAEDLSPFETSLEADEPEPSALLSEFNDSQDEDSLWEESTTSELSVSAVTPEVDFFSDSDEPEPSALLSEFETSTTEELLWEETPQAEAVGTSEESLWDETEASPFELESLDESMDSTEESLWEETPQAESLDASLGTPEESLWDEATEESPFELESLDESIDSTEESLWEETPQAEAVETPDESLWDETEASPFELESLDASLEVTEESPFELESLDASLDSTEESPFELESLDESLDSTEESPFELESLDASLDSTEESLWEETPQAESVGTSEESLWDETEESPFELESLDESLDSTEESPFELESLDESLDSTEESPFELESLDESLNSTEELPFELESLDESLETTEESPFELESLDESLETTEESLWEETPQAEAVGTSEESLWDETEESPFELESLDASLDSTEESPFELESLDESLETTEESLWEETPQAEAVGTSEESLWDETEASPFELESLDESLEATEESPFELESLEESLEITEESPFELESLDASLDSTEELPDITDEEEADLLYAFEPESDVSAGIDETSFDEILLAGTSVDAEELPPITDEEEADILQAFEPQQEGLEPLWEETASLDEQGMVSAKPFEADVWEDNLLETTSELAGASDEEEAEILKAFELDDEGKSPWDDGELTNSRLPETVILDGEPLGSTQETEEDTLWDELDPFAEMTETLQPGTTDDEEAELLQAFEPEREEMAVSDTDEPLPYAGMSLNDEDEEFLNVFEDSEELAIFEESEVTQTEAITEEPEELFAGLDTEISETAQWDELSDDNLSDTSELESSFDENAFAESSWEEEQITSEIFAPETLMDEDELLAALEGDEENLAEIDALTLEEVDTSSYDQSDPLASLLDEDLQDDDQLFGSTSKANLSADEDPLADLFPDESLEEFDPFASLSTGEQESEDSDEMDDNPFADMGFSASDTPPPPPPSNNSNP